MVTNAGLRALRRIQIGAETTHGTGVPATLQLVGTLGMRSEQELYMPDDLETGRLASFERSTAIARETTLPFESDANYEQIEHLLRMAVPVAGTGGFTATSPVSGVNATARLPETGANYINLTLLDPHGTPANSWTATVRVGRGSGTAQAARVGTRLRVDVEEATLTLNAAIALFNTIPGVVASLGGGAGTTVINTTTNASFSGGRTRLGTGAGLFEPGYGSANTYTSYTMEYGDDQQVWESTYVLARQLEISGSVGEVVRVSADLFGREQVVSNFTPNLSLPTTINAVKMAEAKFYVNDSWADITGNTPTEVGATLVDFNYRITTGLSPLKFADRRLDYTEVTQAKRSVELDMTVGFNSTTTAWFNSLFASQSLYMYKLEFDGPNNQALDLYISGYMTEFAELTEREGQDIVRLKIASAYDSTGSRDMRVNLYA